MVFLPFVNPATDDARQRLACRVGEILATDEKGEQLLTLFLDSLNNERFRKELKRAYVDADLGDANAVSMSLYVGPFRDASLASRSVFSLDPFSSSRPGWLLTGDAKLKHAKPTAVLALVLQCAKTSDRGTHAGSPWIAAQFP